MKSVNLLVMFTMLILQHQGCDARGRGGAFANHQEGYRHNLRISSVGDACKFKTYNPGGAKVTIEGIEIAVAKVESQGLYTIFANSEEEMGSLVSESLKAAGLTSTAVSTLQHFKQIVQLGNVNPTLAVFTTMLNLAFPSTEAGAVLDATNDALLKMTNQINQQFENAKLYVDEKVLSSKKQDLKGRLDKMRNQLKICYQRDPDNAAECLSEKHDDFRSDRSVFFLYKDALRKQKEKPLTTFEEHMLEATVVTAREYVVEYFLITKLIVDGLKDASSEKDLLAKHYYLTAMKDDATASLDYFENVIEAIRHEYNRLTCVKGETIKCDPKETSGDLTTRDCTCRFLGNQDICKITIEENSDKSTSSEGSYIYVEETQWNGPRDTEYLANEDIKRVEAMEQIYRDRLNMAIIKYWADQIGVFFQVFRSIINYANKELQLVDQKLRAL